MEEPRDDVDEREAGRIRIIEALTRALETSTSDMPQGMQRGTVGGISRFRVQASWLGGVLSLLETALARFPNNKLERDRQLFWEEHKRRDAEFYQARREGRATEEVRRTSGEEVEMVSSLTENVILHLQNST